MNIKPSIVCAPKRPAKPCLFERIADRHDVRLGAATFSPHLSRALRRDPGHPTAGETDMRVSWSGIREEYSENMVKRYAPHHSGIYFLWVRLQDMKWRCFYVGQALDLEDRLLAHLAPAEPNDCLKLNVSRYVCGFEYAVVALPIDRAGIEKFLYDYYQPKCNQVDPGGTPIAVNLP
jgi:hypothetical protein